MFLAATFAIFFEILIPRCTEDVVLSVRRHRYLIHLLRILQNLPNLIQNLSFSVYIVPLVARSRSSLEFRCTEDLVLSVRHHKYLIHLLRILQNLPNLIQNLSFLFFLGIYCSSPPCSRSSLEFRCTEDAWSYWFVATGSYLIHLPRILQNLPNLIQNLLFSVYIVPLLDATFAIFFGISISRCTEDLVLSVRRHKLVSHPRILQNLPNLIQNLSFFILFLAATFAIFFGILIPRCTKDAWSYRFVTTGSYLIHLPRILQNLPNLL